MTAPTLNPPPLDPTLRFYEEHATEYVKETLTLDMVDLHPIFLRHLSPGAYILDAGCGSGRDSAYFAQRGYHVVAIDQSPAMVRSTRHLGVHAEVMKFQDMEFHAEFDGIWACASLLHIPHAEIADVLCRFGRALKPGGILFITLKEGEGEGIAEDGRFFAYYQRQEFLQILSRLQVWSNLDSRRVMDDRGRPWLNFIARKSGPRERTGAKRPGPQFTGFLPQG